MLAISRRRMIKGIYMTMLTTIESDSAFGSHPIAPLKMTITSAAAARVSAQQAAGLLAIPLAAILLA